MNTEITTSTVIHSDKAEVRSRLSRRGAIVEFSILSILLASSFLGLNTNINVGNVCMTVHNPQASLPVCCLLVVIFLLINGGFRSIDFSLRYSWKGYLISIVLLTIIINVLTGVVAWFAQHKMGLVIDYSSLEAVTRNPYLLTVFLVVVFPLFAFLEELFYRGYLIQRLETVFGRRSFSTPAAVIISCLLFSLAHWNWGPGAAVSTSASALLFALIYLSTGRNIWLVTMVHYFGNAISLLVKAFS
jgi:membrane protease YdiL (CAAX protease family)